jgi:transglutaminase-like putative cysteine protease
VRFDIHYRTTFSYAADIVESHNELRAAPATNDRQTMIHYDVRTTPTARVFSYVDYWGTRVDAFGVRAPHDRLDVLAEATIETSPAPPIASSPRWEDLDDAFRDEHHEYLDPSPHTAWSGALVDDARRRRDESGGDVIGTVLALHRSIGTGFAYTPGATYIGVPTADVYESRAGVCQDFAHVLIAMCRSIGVPARYVSGYFFARDDTAGAEPEEDRIEVQTHAWVEAAIPGGGWLRLDPTNRMEVGPRHVKIGHGRDYGDVAPMRGVYTGGNSEQMSASVEMRRLAAEQQQQ